NVPTIYTDLVPAGETATLLDVLYEDARLVVVRKPSGLPVIPDRTRDVPSCLELLTRRELAARPEKDPGEYIRYRIVHRIDRLTSGLVIVAKTSEAERELCADFESRHVRKEYLALVRGRVSGSRIVVPGPIAPGRKGKMRWVSKDTPGAKDALTVFDVVERFAAVTLVRAQPRTGRQHQIRVHAWAMGHPLAVDPLYAVGERAHGDPVPGIERLTLHAYRYTLAPHWELPRSFVCPLDDDFAEAIERLRFE
ncbi:MAG: RluA family pseudouridine synthase, partial [Planctomycetes bacterium]|nr:RluA family pseudouridine synthase [Planctomycetota bacterium]